MAITEQTLTYYLTVFLVLTLSRTLAKRDKIQIFYDKINCIGTKDYIDNATCSCIRAPLPSSVSVDFIIKKVVEDFRMDFIVNLSRGKDLCFTILNVQQVEPCALFQTKTSIPIYNAIIKSLKQNGNVPKCPIPAFFHYKLTNMTLDPDLVPSYLPDTLFTVIIRLFNKKVSFMDITIKGKAVHS